MTISENQDVATRMLVKACAFLLKHVNEKGIAVTDPEDQCNYVIFRQNGQLVLEETNEIKHDYSFITIRDFS